MADPTTTTSPAEERVTQERAAVLLGVTVKTLRTWETRPWFPAAGRTEEGYDVAEIAAARPRAPGPEGPESALRTKAREAEHIKTIEEGIRARVRREMDELRLREQQGDLIPRLGVEASYADLLTGIADWCEQLPDVFCAMLSIPEQYHPACRETLRELLEGRQRELRDDLEAKAHARDTAPKPAKAA